MITLKSQREIEAMDRAGDFLASIHIGLRDLIKPGLDLWEVEEYVRRRCKEANVLPLQIGVEGSLMDYPYATCCGLNDEVAHAFPRHVILKDGDLLKVDMVLSEPLDKSVLDVSKLDFDNVAQVKKYTESYSGGLADSCWAYAVGNVSQEVKDLMDVTKECLYKGIEKRSLAIAWEILVQRFKSMQKAKAMAWCVIWSDTVSGLPCMKNQWSHIMVVLDAVFAYVKGWS